MVYAIAVLLLSALTLVGILAIWAASSQVPWLWRTFAFLGFISSLLFVPAIEPFVAFALQGAIIAAGVTWIPWADARCCENSTESYRYKLGTLLLIVIPISVLLAAFTRIQKSLNQDAWQSIVIIGVAGGICSFTGWWMGSRKAKDWWVRLGVAFVSWVSVSAVAARCDWFVICLENLGYWPPVKSGTGWGFFGVYGRDENVNIWYFVLGAQMLITNYLVQESTLILASLKSRKWPKFKGLAIVNFVFLSLFVAGPSLLVGYEFLTRYALPNTRMPQPNGYEDYLDACRRMPTIRIVDQETFELLKANEAELQEATKELSGALAKVHQGLTKPSSVPVDYYDSECPDDVLDDFRSLCWGLYAQGRLAQCQEEMDHAANRFLDLISFAISSSRGGFIFHDQQSIHITEHGLRELYLCMNELPTKMIPEYIERLQRLESKYEPAEYFVRRTDIWMQRSRGWYGHLASLFGEQFHPRLFEVHSYLCARRQISTSFKLLETELAIQAYQAEYQKLPESLAELVPEYLSKILVDPHSPNNDYLKYLRDQNSYILYSLGPDGEDDNGERAWQSLSYAVHGDFRLSDLYNPAQDSAQDGE